MEGGPELKESADYMIHGNDKLFEWLAKKVHKLYAATAMELKVKTCLKKYFFITFSVIPNFIKDAPLPIHEFLQRWISKTIFHYTPPRNAH